MVQPVARLRRRVREVRNEANDPPRTITDCGGVSQRSPSRAERDVNLPQATKNATKAMRKLPISRSIVSVTPKMGPRDQLIQVPV